MQRRKRLNAYELVTDKCKYSHPHLFIIARAHGGPSPARAWRSIFSIRWWQLVQSHALSARAASAFARLAACSRGGRGCWPRAGLGPLAGRCGAAPWPGRSRARQKRAAERKACFFPRRRLAPGGARARRRRGASARPRLAPPPPAARGGRRQETRAFPFFSSRPARAE